MNGSDWLALVGYISIVVALVVIGLLSRRLGSATRAAPYYIGFFVAALLVAAGVVARLANAGYTLAAADALRADPLWLTLYTGLPALGVTLGVYLAWRYWSWLLAERD